MKYSYDNLIFPCPTPIPERIIMTVKHHLYNLKTKEDYYKTLKEMREEFNMGAGAHFLVQEKYMSCKNHTLYKNKDKPYGSKSLTNNKNIYKMQNIETNEIVMMTYHEATNEYGISKQLIKGEYKKSKGFKLIEIIKP